MSELLKFQILPEVESITHRLINKLLTNYVEGFNLTIIKEGIFNFSGANTFLKVKNSGSAPTFSFWLEKPAGTTGISMMKLLRK